LTLATTSRAFGPADKPAKSATAEMVFPFGGCKKKLFIHGMIRLRAAARHFIVTGSVSRRHNQSAICNRRVIVLG
jgi:hypothetical protein